MMLNGEYAAFLFGVRIIYESVYIAYTTDVQKIVINELARIFHSTGRSKPRQTQNHALRGLIWLGEEYLLKNLFNITE